MGDVASDAALVEPVAPVLAWYYPQFTQGWDVDAANAVRAGIDALVVSQTGTGPGAPLAAAGIVQAARGSPLFFATGVEPQMYPDQASLVAELQRILAVDAANPWYLCYQDRPVLVFWALSQVPRAPGQSPQDAWRAIRAQVDPDRTSVWIAEGGDASPATGTISYLDAFDGLHLYSIAWDADPGRALAGWARRLRSYDPSKLWVATVMPGGLWGGADPSSWQERDRQNGGYLVAAWQGAIATQPAMVIVTSFNENRERTQIQPSAEWGDPDLYLDLNRQLADEWRASLGLPAAGG